MSEVGIPTDSGRKRPVASELRVLLSAKSFFPSYGGPAFSVSRLGLALAEARVNVGLWAPDGSAVSSSIPACHPRLKCLDGPPENALINMRPDVVHDNGIWMTHNHRLAVLAIRHSVPRVVSVRGMLEPWAREHKRLKKALAWWLYQRADLMHATALHATASIEAGNLERLGLNVPIRMIPNVPIRMIPNGVDIPPAKRANHHVAHSIKMALFVGRIYPVKGLPMLIEAWARVFPDGWRLVIVGPDERGHRSEIETLVRKYDLSDRVTFLGPVDPEKRASLYATADLFILPTHSESFGMVIAEALAHGLPVLTTKGAPWPSLEEEECGWWVDVSVEGLVEGLRRATACDRQTLAAMGTRGRAFVAREYSWEAIVKLFVRLYSELLQIPLPVRT